MDPFLGQIMMFGGSYAPTGWALCDGQLLSIAQNSALFSLLGTAYGGDGQVSFGLPDLRGRFPMHPGLGPGLSQRNLGQKGGSQTHATAPAHTHGVQIPATVGEGESTQPTGQVLAAGEFPSVPYGATPDTALQVFNTASNGGGAADHMNPFQCVTFIIALVGIYPSRP